jgi:RNA polymerase sigma-32 factor
MAKSKIGSQKSAKPKKPLVPEIVDRDSTIKTKTVGKTSKSDSKAIPVKSNKQFSDSDYRKNSATVSKIESEDLVDPDIKALAPADPITVYMNEIRKYPLLTREQELELAKKYYETKDPAAAQALVTANLRFVVKVAAEYSKFGARMIDLVQEGNMGLMHAVRDFNPYKGVRLITYAVWWIKGYIQEYLMKQYSMVKIGTTQNQKRLFYQLKKERENLDNMGDSSNLKQIAEKLGIPEEEVQIMAQRMSGRDVSLSAPVDEDSPTRLMDLQKNTSPAPDEELSKFEEIDKLKTTIESLRPELTEREKIILEERLLNDEPLTLQEIGDKYGITREAVRQMEARLMQKIKGRLPSIR